MIKCRTKELAVKGAEILNREFGCYYDGYYNIIGFKSEFDELRALQILRGEY